MSVEKPKEQQLEGSELYIMKHSGPGVAHEGDDEPLP